MVTPEMLLFLAGKMGLPNPCIINGGRESPIAWTAGGEFNPATDDAQFGRLVVWAWQQGLEVQSCRDRIDAHGKRDDVPWWFNCYHDSTPDSIRAAAVVAICRALGFDAAMEADK